MNVAIFKKNETEYFNWLKGNPNGYVVNTKSHIARSYMALHLAKCSSISKYKKNASPDAFTGKGYIKICADDVNKLLVWIKQNGGDGFTEICSKCSPPFNVKTSDLEEISDKLLPSSEEELLEDIAELERLNASPTERLALVNARIGQGRFRADVTVVWNNGEACGLTGLAVPEMLVASHIKPWRDSTDTERLDPINGLLLAAHVDKLFDRHLLSFENRDSRYWCVLHPRIRHQLSAMALLGKELLLTDRLTEDEAGRFASYMKIHHDRFIGNIANAQLKTD